MEADQRVLVQVEERDGGRIARVVVNDPDKRNRLGVEGKARLIEVLGEMALDDRLRVAVLTGAGERSFIGGSDLSQMAHFDLAQARDACTKTHYACKALRDLPVPVIARINGYCFGSGMELAASCDMRALVDHALLGMPEVRFGIPSGMEACLLPQLIGWGRTRELVFTGRHITAREAFDWGYAERLVPAAELDAAVDAWIADILRGGPRVMRAQKRLVQDWERLSIVDAAHAGIRAFVEAYRTDEPKRMMLEFVDRPRGRA